MFRSSDLWCLQEIVLPLYLPFGRECASGLEVYASPFSALLEERLEYNYQLKSAPDYSLYKLRTIRWEKRKYGAEQLRARVIEKQDVRVQLVRFSLAAVELGIRIDPNLSEVDRKLLAQGIDDFYQLLTGRVDTESTLTALAELRGKSDNPRNWKQAPHMVISPKSWGSEIGRIVWGAKYLQDAVATLLHCPQYDPAVIQVGNTLLNQHLSAPILPHFHNHA